MTPCAHTISLHQSYPMIVPVRPLLLCSEMSSKCYVESSLAPASSIFMAYHPLSRPIVNHPCSSLSHSNIRQHPSLLPAPSSLRPYPHKPPSPPPSRFIAFGILHPSPHPHIRFLCITSIRSEEGNRPEQTNSFIQQRRSGLIPSTTNLTDDPILAHRC